MHLQSMKIFHTFLKTSKSLHNESFYLGRRQTCPHDPQSWGKTDHHLLLYYKQKLKIIYQLCCRLIMKAATVVSQRMCWVTQRRLLICMSTLLRFVPLSSFYSLDQHFWFVSDFNVFPGHAAPHDLFSILTEIRSAFRESMKNLVVLGHDALTSEQ